MSSGKCRPSCLGLNVLKLIYVYKRSTSLGPLSLAETGCSLSGKKSGKFQSHQKSWKSLGILKWVREFSNSRGRQGKVTKLYMSLEAQRLNQNA